MMLDTGELACNSIGVLNPRLSENNSTNLTEFLSEEKEPSRYDI